MISCFNLFIAPEAMLIRSRMSGDWLIQSDDASVCIKFHGCLVKSAVNLNFIKNLLWLLINRLVKFSWHGLTVFWVIHHF